MGIHIHENYGLGKHSDGGYFCLNCGDIIKGSETVSSLTGKPFEVTTPRRVGVDWPLQGKKDRTDRT